MKVLVTGATGFIGEHVIGLLLQKNVDVVASSYNEEKARKRMWYDSVTYIPLNFSDLRPEVNYFDFFGCPDVLIHLAWEGLPDYKNVLHVSKYLPLQKIFLRNMVQNGLSNLTVTGTCLEYGMQEGELKEDVLVEPLVPYAVAKNELRIFLEELQHKHSFLFKWLRLFYMMGLGQNPKSLFSQLDTALKSGEKVFDMSGGEQVRDYLPVSEVARSIVEAAMQTRICGIINCCSGVPVSVSHLVNSYLRSKGEEILLNKGAYPYLSYEPMQFWGNAVKLKEILGGPPRKLDFLDKYGKY